MDKEIDDESQPFMHKYLAREKYKALLNNKYLRRELIDEHNSQIHKCALGIVEFKLGVNFLDCEEY